MKNKLLARSARVVREAISKLKFPVESVHVCDKSKKSLALKIHKATYLGNLEQKKVNILFNDSEGLKNVKTTIWAQNKDYVYLKNNIQVPVHRIVDILI